MKIFQKMKLSYLIIILVILPTSILIGLTTIVLNSEINTNREMHELSMMTNLSIKLSNLVHEQQKERGVTAVFISSDGVKFVTKLQAQRKLTDQKKNALVSFLKEVDTTKYGTVFSKKLTSLLMQVDKMIAIRQKIDALNIPLSDAFGYYTALNAQNFEFMNYIATQSTNAQIATHFIAYTSFLQDKESAGIERAVVAQQISAGKFTANILDRFKRLIAVQDTYNDMFLMYATQGQINLFETIMSSNEISLVKEMRKTILNAALNGAFENITSASWFDAMTVKINLLKDVEDLLSKELLNSINVLEEGARSSLWIVALVMTACLIIVFVMSFAIIFSVNSSFRVLTSRMTSLTEGDLELTLPEITNNEIGKISACLHIFKDNAIEKVNMERHQQKDKLIQEQDKQAIMLKLADECDENIGTIVSIVSNSSSSLQDTASNMSSISQITSNNAGLVATASKAASASVSEVAVASEEMSKSIGQISKQIEQASQASQKAVDEVGKSSKEMQDLADTVEKIGNVTTLIANIADQTNLLALNATIESARAGEAGRGFAVVAAEVKDLAGKTANATNDISRHISEVEQATKHAIVSMDGISKAIESVDNISKSVVITMEEQRFATNEISNNAQEADKGTCEVSENISEVTIASNKAEEASKEVMVSASELLEQSVKLRSEVDKFTNGVRAIG